MSLADMSMFVHAGSLVVLAIAFLAFLAILVLRFLRRGSSRFWMTPGALSLVLLPAVLGAGFTTAAFRQTLEGVALTGSGGVAALAAGSAEALIPLLVGLASVAALAFVGLLLTMVGSSRVTPGGSGGGWVLLAAALLALLLSAGLTVLAVQTVAAVHGGLRDPRALLLRLNVSLAGSAALGAMLLLLALVTALRAPRGASPLAFKLACLSALSLCGLLALAGIWVAYGELQGYERTALTGLPDVALPAPPPPPPAPPGSLRTGPSPDEAAEAGHARSEGVRVGGTIKEPRKLKNVPPVYPDIAKQARVQGVVILECTISPDGRVSQVKVLRGVPLLDQSAIDAVEQWVYEPTLLNGVPVPVIMTVTVTFRLGPG